MATASEQRKLLRRSRSDRVLGGVCGGLAAYFDVDPLLVRIAFVIVALAQGAGVLVYLALWILVPPEGGDHAPAGETLRRGVDGIRTDLSEAAARVRADEPRAHRQAAWFGALLIAAGVYLLAVNLGAFWWWDWRYFGPALLILLGVLLLVRRFR